MIFITLGRLIVEKEKNHCSFLFQMPSGSCEIFNNYLFCAHFALGDHEWLPLSTISVTHLIWELDSSKVKYVINVHGHGHHVNLEVE